MSDGETLNGREEIPDQYCCRGREMSPDYSLPSGVLRSMYHEITKELICIKENMHAVPRHY